MLTIRREQMRTLEESLEESLIAAAADHIRVSLPQVFEELGADQVRQSVQVAKTKSSAYGFDTWAEVVGYLDLMYILGFDFDEHARYPWAKELLTAPEPSGEERLQYLLDMALREAEAAHASGASD